MAQASELSTVDPPPSLAQYSFDIHTTQFQGLHGPFRKPCISHVLALSLKYSSISWGYTFEVILLFGSKISTWIFFTVYFIANIFYYSINFNYAYNFLLKHFITDNLTLHCVNSKYMASHHYISSVTIITVSDFSPASQDFLDFFKKSCLILNCILDILNVMLWDCVFHR